MAVFFRTKGKDGQRWPQRARGRAEESKTNAPQVLGPTGSQAGPGSGILKFEGFKVFET